MTGLDKKDEKILRLLKENARMPFVEIGAKVGLSEAAIRRRVHNMVKRTKIKRFTVDVNTGANAIALISVSPSAQTPEVAQELKRLRGVEVVYEITGEYDVAVIIGATNVGEINRCIDEIRKIDGVGNTNTVIILRTIR